MELAGLAIGALALLATLYPIFIRPRLKKHRLKRVNNYITEAGLKNLRLRFSREFREEFNHAMGYKPDDQTFEGLSFCSAKGIDLGLLWSDTHLAMELFITHDGEGNATVYNRIKLLRMYANR